MKERIIVVLSSEIHSFVSISVLMLVKPLNKVASILADGTSSDTQTVNPHRPLQDQIISSSACQEYI